MSEHVQLSEFVLRNHVLSPAEIARPWTYLHRQFYDDHGNRCSELTGVAIQRDDGSVLRVNRP